jgi:hypothetical protein
MAKKGKRSNPSCKNYFANYKSSNKEVKNRERKILNHLKNHPNDKQSQHALGVKTVHRKKPTGKKAIRRPNAENDANVNVEASVYKLGHPVLRMLKNVNFDNAKKFRNAAVISSDFKAAYPRHVS